MSGKHNAQIAKIISAWGESGAGHRVVLKAVAERQGLCEDEIEKLYEGKSDVKLKVPSTLRAAV